MKVKVFYPDRNDRISFSKKELEELLDEVYREGYSDGRNSVHYWTYTTPYYGGISNSPYITTATSSATRIEPVYTSSTNATNAISTSQIDSSNSEIDLSALKYQVEYK